MAVADSSASDGARRCSATRPLRSSARLSSSIRRMSEAGLICESDKKIDPDLDDERRVYYSITALGQQTLAVELRRYRQVVAVPRERSLLPEAWGV
jgi:DNA-binding MarR family transcriptional regulator